MLYLGLYGTFTIIHKSLTMTEHEKMISTGARTVRLADSEEILGTGSPPRAPPLPGVCTSISTEITSWNVAFARSISTLLGHCWRQLPLDGFTFKRTLGECLKSILDFKMSRFFSHSKSSGGWTPLDSWDMLGPSEIPMLIAPEPSPAIPKHPAELQVAFCPSMLRYLLLWALNLL